MVTRGPRQAAAALCDHKQPRWDSHVRSAPKKAAAAEGLDFPGFGPHSLRRANITWRQEVGGSAIETSKIAGHASTAITDEYTLVGQKRPDELTGRIQEKRARERKVVEMKKKGGGGVGHLCRARLRGYDQ